MALDRAKDAAAQTALCYPDPSDRHAGGNRLFTLGAA
jgi:hypothetical protein